MSVESPASAESKPSRGVARPWLRALRFTAIAAAATALCGAAALALAVTLAWQRLPDVSQLAQNYQPKQPLRIYTAEGQLIGEFGEERRELVRLAAIPLPLQQAVLAVEDARFYAHGGIDAKGLLRALAANFTGGMRQGASTITMQVARNLYLTNERSLSRKFNEALLALRLEAELSKEQILEIYLNHIYLGQRSYGFAAAAQTYFDKSLGQLTLAETALLAGLPQAPGAANPVASPQRAQARQRHVIARMRHAGFIDAQQAQAALAEPLQLRERHAPGRLQAEHVAEAVRQQIVQQYGDAAYTRGLKVYTTLVASEQKAAVQALRRGILDYEARQPYRGAEAQLQLPKEAQAQQQAIDEALQDRPDSGELIAAVVLQADASGLTALRSNGNRLKIGAAGLRSAAARRLQRGAVIRVTRSGGASAPWVLTQMPEVEGALVALDPRDGAVRALVGGFDFASNHFNHVTQAWRQPGSSFKPFIFSAALEKGFLPASIVEDAPLDLASDASGAKPWSPRNYGGDHAGPMPLGAVLAQSRNLATLRLLESIGVGYAQDWIGHFGFAADKHPAYLPMGLGAGSVTPMQMAAGYAVFANGGFALQPTLITRVTDAQGTVLEVSTPRDVRNNGQRVIPERNAFLMNAMLQGVMREGTGRRAWNDLQQRSDLHGKTGTTNQSHDAWFAGYQPTRVAVAWLGYDQPRQLGQRGETGGSLAMPVWRSYMQAALRGVPVAASMQAPEGLVLDAQGDWADAGAEPLTLLASAAPLALEDEVVQATEPPAPLQTPERNWILDLFR